MRSGTTVALTRLNLAPTSITILGAGNTARAVAGIAAAGGNLVQILARDPQKAA